MLFDISSPVRQYGLGCSDPMNEDGLAATLGQISSEADLVFIDASIVPQARRSIADGSIDTDQAEQLSDICGRINRILHKEKTRISPDGREELVKLVQEESDAATRLNQRIPAFASYQNSISDLGSVPPASPVPAEYERIYDEFVSALTFLKETYKIEAKNSTVDNLAYALTLTVINPGKYSVVLTQDESYSKLFYVLVGLMASDDLAVSDNYVEKLGGLGLRVTKCNLRSPLQSYEVDMSVRVESLVEAPYDWNAFRIRDEQQKNDIMERVKSHVLKIIEYKQNPSAVREEAPAREAEQPLQNGNGVLRERVERALNAVNGFAKNLAVVDYFTRLCLEVESIAGRELDQAGLEREVKQILNYARSNEDMGVTPAKGLAIMMAYAKDRLAESPGAKVYRLLAETGYKKPGRKAVQLSAGAEILLSNIKFLSKQRTNRTPNLSSWVAKRVFEDSIGITSLQARRIIKKAGILQGRWPFRRGKKKFMVNKEDLNSVVRVLEDMKVEVLDISRLEEIFA